MQFLYIFSHIYVGFIDYISIVKQLKSEIYLLICSKVQLFYCPVLSSLNS